MFSFSSKYALALYEMVQKRGNLKHKFSEEFPLDRFRSLLGVPQGKLVQFFHLKQRALDPAVLEVNGLGEFGCKVETVYKGRKVTDFSIRNSKDGSRWVTSPTLSAVGVAGDFDDDVRLL